ncbi:LAFE_0F03950g1_1 [Lachancea fermentati]|uniref:LAFE_0F03950g1_1 n=1 Tax=Lachancea fermentati TaxID=4955 RepID=A0A1G4MEU3_LACFM|nr:LAFE_0F03950g1_1 [Lachancea fermentati]
MTDKAIDPSKADVLTHALAGAAGGAISMALTYPLVVVTTKLQAQDSDCEKSPKTLAEAVEYVYEEQGLLGFFAGLESAVYGMAVANFVYYYFYELSSRCVLRIRQNKRLNTGESMLVGTIAGSMTAFASNPLWVANTRMTISKSEKSTLSTIIEIIKNEGFHALFNGLKPALVLVVNPIIQYTVYEQLKNVVLEVRRKSTISPSWAFLLGALGKLAATGSTYPYVTMKTRMHLLVDSELEGEGYSKPTMLGLMAAIVRKDGIAGLYRGIGIKLVQSILTAAFLFFFKEGLVIWSIRVLRIFRQFNKRRLA